ncbi:MAG TPA: hypothetical protein VJM12_10450 [Pyrinomonadaceae bacterium]|nr:hypothetical protein [Pyrinomonadaceae bacterium]
MKYHIRLSWYFTGLMLVIVFAPMASAQEPSKPAPSPATKAERTSPSEDPTNGNDELGNIRVISSVEIGVRGLSVSGSDNKYRSDLNYNPGVRLFDSSFFLRAKEGSGEPFDEFLVNTSGWGGDPNGHIRVSVEKSGIYRFDANIRRARYFNAVASIANPLNRAIGQHTSNTRHQFSDFDFTGLPESDKFKFYLGYSRDTRKGPGTTTMRFSGDEYEISSNSSAQANNFRAGVDAQVLGFDLSFLQGVRYFDDDTNYSVTLTNPGNNPTNNSRIDRLFRETPTNGTHVFTRFSAHRLFAKKLDFTGRFIYLSGRSRYTFLEETTGRLSNGNLAVPDTFTASGEAKRPSAIGDVGVTLLATDNLRISNTFRFDNFRINGAEPLVDVLRQTTFAGAPLPTITTTSFFVRSTNYRRFMNTIEADYQFSPNYLVHAGYRFTDRHIELFHLDRTTTLTTRSETVDNQTHAAIFGLKARPVKGWTIYFDGEHGNADSVFTRLANNDFTNLRLRNRINASSTLALNFSLITKDNSNPADVITSPSVPFGTPPGALDVNIKSRHFTSSVDWTPNGRFSLSSGYTHLRLTSIAGILLPISGQRRVGESQYFSRDNFFFFHAFVRPTSRVTLYGGYRINKDEGQGDRMSPSNVILIDSYPMSFQSPEARITVRLNRVLDWNFGYTYYNYKDKIFPAQNYHAHLPYTSLRINFGRGE